MQDGVTLVLPALNEAGNIGRVVEEALRVLPGCVPEFEIVVVDDGSADGTSAEIEALSAREPRVRLARHGRTRGYGAALRTGIAEARLPIVVLCDGDGQIDPADIPRVLGPLRRGDADVVAGCRSGRSDPPHRRIFSIAWSGLVRSLFAIAPRDVNCGLKALPRDVARSLDLRSDGGFLSAELLGKSASAGLRVAEVTVAHRPRERGTPTGARPAVVLRAFRELLRLGLPVSLHGPPAPRAGALARFIPAPRPLAWILTVMLAVLYGAWTARVVARDMPVDYYQYLISARALAQGEDIWTMEGVDWERHQRALGIPEAAPPYRYPPLTAVALRPFLHLERRTGAAIWISLLAAASIASAWVVGALLRCRWGLPLALATLGGFTPAMHALYAGQAVPFVVLAIGLAMLALDRGRPGAGGALLALGIHVKIVPAVHVAWLAGTRRWRAFAGALAALAALAAVLEAASPGSWRSWLGNFPRLAEWGVLRQEPWNQSVNGFLSRVLSGPAISGGTVYSAVTSVNLALVGATAWLCMRAGTAAGTTLLQVSLVSSAMVLVSPYSYHYQYLFLHAPALILADRALEGRPRRGILIALAACHLATDAYGVFRTRAQEIPVVAFLPFFCALLLWILLARELRAASR